MALVTFKLLNPGVVEDGAGDVLQRGLFDSGVRGLLQELGRNKHGEK